MKKKRLSRNIAKVEFIANEETIKNMIAEGYPLKVVHEILSQEKGIKMAYTTFAFHYRKAKERLQKSSENIEHKNNHTKQENKNKTSSPPIIVKLQRGRDHRLRGVLGHRDADRPDRPARDTDRGR